MKTSTGLTIIHKHLPTGNVKVDVYSEAELEQVQFENKVDTVVNQTLGHV
ncbi:hypothetical protein [Muricauda sp. MAR_2010_75]|nr:hypothetical protein [Muricauda sp. MAR_2010_75]